MSAPHSRNHIPVIKQDIAVLLGQPRPLHWSTQVRLIFGDTMSTSGWLVLAAVLLIIDGSYLVQFITPFLTDSPSSPSYHTTGGPIDNILFNLLFMLLPLGFVIKGTYKGVGALRLLRSGHFALARLVDKRRTGTEVNHRRVYEMSFVFTTPSGEQHTARNKTLWPNQVEDELFELVVYHPDEPSKASLVDILPGHPKVNAQGEIPPTVASAVLVLVAPVVVLLELAAWVALSL